MAREKYPLQAAQRRMLEVVQGKVEAARRADHWRYRAIISIYEVGALGEEIGLDEFDAVEMFRRLWREGYFEATGIDRGVTDERGHPLPFLHAHVEGLTEKGLREIGKLPDPGEKLINAFEAARESIERSGLPEPKKRELLDRVRLVIDALRTAEGLADLAGRMFGG